MPGCAICMHGGCLSTYHVGWAAVTAALQQGRLLLNRYLMHMQCSLHLTLCMMVTHNGTMSEFQTTQFHLHLPNALWSTSLLYRIHPATADAHSHTKKLLNQCYNKNSAPKTHVLYKECASSGTSRLPSAASSDKLSMLPNNASAGNASAGWALANSSPVNGTCTRNKQRTTKHQTLPVVQ